MKPWLRRLRAGIVLVYCFVLAVIRSGWETTCIILRAPRAATPGFVEYSFAPMSDGAGTMLACLICLTPGTTAIDVVPRRGWMRLHLLDITQREAALREIRERFE